MFLVISGFLITRILVHDAGTAGGISLPRFYARRARRILPALFCTTVFTSIGAFLLFTPEECSRFGASMLFAVLNLANVYFCSGTQYYAVGPEIDVPNEAREIRGPGDRVPAARDHRRMSRLDRLRGDQLLAVIEPVAEFQAHPFSKVARARADAAGRRLQIWFALALGLRDMSHSLSKSTDGPGFLAPRGLPVLKVRACCTGDPAHPLADQHDGLLAARQVQTGNRPATLSATPPNAEAAAEE